MNGDIQVISVRPTSTDNELIAIVSAIQQLWPTPQHRRHVEPDTSWRFSARGWRLARPYAR